MTTPRGRGDAPIEAPALNTPDDTAIVFLEDYAGRVPLDVYEDLHADIAQLVTDEREWVAAARDEGRQEAVRPDDLYAAILDELVELWGEPADVVSQQVRPQVARSIVNRYVTRHGRSSDPTEARFTQDDVDEAVRDALDEEAYGEDL